MYDTDNLISACAMSDCELTQHHSALLKHAEKIIEFLKNESSSSHYNRLEDLRTIVRYFAVVKDGG